MVRLKERKFCHVNSREHTFKFHMVRLKALSKDELAKILRFKFHMVRLKVGGHLGVVRPCAFKFHMVRLKARSCRP